MDSDDTDIMIVSSLARFPRPVVAEDNSLIVLLCGYSANCHWRENVAAPATQACKDAISHVVRSPEEVSFDSAPTLQGGVGTTFDEPEVSPVPGLEEHH